MAVRAAIANGNLTSASTWGLVDATSYLDSQANNTSLTTSYVESAGFTPGAITVDGIGIKVAARSNSPSGTVSVRIAQAGSLVSGTEVTINVSDIADCVSSSSTSSPETDDSTGWVFFVFGTPVSLSAATEYTISAKCSVNAELTLYRNATAGNWSRYLRTTTTGAPAAGDDMIIVGERDSAASVTARTVTMDSTATTQYGSASTTAYIAALFVGDNGTLTYGTTAATNYRLLIDGYIRIANGGTINVGTTGTPMPRDSTAWLQIACDVDAEFGLTLCDGGTLNLQGQSRSSGQNYSWDLLGATLAASSTALVTANSTGWLSGDTIIITPTGPTYTDEHQTTLNGDASGTSITLTASDTVAHLGATAPFIGAVGNLTRNVKFGGDLAAGMTNILVGQLATFDADWTEFEYMGNSSTEAAFYVTTTTGGFSLDYCSIHDVEDDVVAIVGSSFNNVYVRNCVFANYNAGSGYFISMVGATSGTDWSISDNLLVGSQTTNHKGIVVADSEGICARNHVAGLSDNGIEFGFTDDVLFDSTQFADNVCHSNNGSGFEFGNSASDAFKDGSVFDGLQAWHNVLGGIQINAGHHGITLQNSILAGNAVGGIDFQATSYDLVLISCILAGTSEQAQPYGFYHDADGVSSIRLYDCDFSVATGLYVAHSTADFHNVGGTWGYGTFQIMADYCQVGASTVVSGLSTGSKLGWVRFQRYNQTKDDHRAYYKFGTILRNASVFNTAAPSVEMQPSSASDKLEGDPWYIPVDDASSRTISVYVRKSASYNGNQPRLIVRRQDSLGITSDTVLDTMTVGTDTWEQLSGAGATVTEDGAYEVIVDCDGTAGSVYVDDRAAT